MGWDCKLYIIYPSFHSGPAKAVVRKAHRTHSNVGSLLTLFRHKKSPKRGYFNGGWGGIRTHVRRLSLNTLSRRAPSTTRPPIHIYYCRSFVVSALRRAPCKIKDFIPDGTVLKDISRVPPCGRYHSPTTRPPIQKTFSYTLFFFKMQALFYQVYKKTLFSFHFFINSATSIRIMSYFLFMMTFPRTNHSSWHNLFFNSDNNSYHFGIARLI